MRFKIVGIGELLWDLLPGGRQLGGAPGNFTVHAVGLGADASLISRVGEDALGREALAQLKARGVSTANVEIDPSRPTGTVGVSISSDGQPKFQIHQNVAWDALQGGANAEAIVHEAAAVCFGTLAQREDVSRSTIRSLVARARRDALRILDVNLRQNYFSRSLIEESLALANALKVNDGELPRLAEMFGLPGDERSQIAQLAADHSLKWVACTRGERGSLLFSEGNWSDLPGAKTKVVDTVGAGDSFTAAMTMGFLKGWPLDEINRRANEIAAFVCTHAGATPELPAELKERFL
jgi:fructokinase